jgi:hypothetical protein
LGYLPKDKRRLPVLWSNELELPLKFWVVLDKQVSQIMIPVPFWIAELAKKSLNEYLLTTFRCKRDRAFTCSNGKKLPLAK